MRAIGAGIGLLSLLIVVAIIMYVFAQSEIPKIQAGKKAEVEVRQFTGYGQDQVPAMDSFATQGLMRGSKMTGLQVTAVTAGGAMDTYYGLQVGDEIVAAAGTPLDAISNGDEELAKGMVVQNGYQRKQPLTVRRNGQTITLPTGAAGSPGAALVPPQPAQPDSSVQQQQPAQPVQPSAPARNGGLQQQLDAIRGAGGATE